ncbi:MAG TPA: hypothetical protein VH062_17185 [Polyangiaceae bacterium]|jgi:hypothetical protein|nr:hypothetical protein [Polyangiaceae bacterium]
MFEGKGEALISTRAFAMRMAHSVGLTLLVALASLAVGSVGYHVTGNMPWVDALLNASMILTGMGPVDRMATTTGKLFASGYALYSGITFISMVGVVVAPVLHRIVHRFHIEEGDEKDDSK